VGLLLIPARLNPKFIIASSELPVKIFNRSKFKDNDKVDIPPLEVISIRSFNVPYFIA